MVIDLPTLVVVAVLLALSLGIGLLLLPSLRRNEPALRFWMLANLSIVLAGLLLPLGESGTARQVVNVIDNVLFVFAGALFYQGILAFDGRPTSRAFLAITVAVSTVGFTWLSLGVDSFQHRVVLVSSLIGALALASVRALLFPGDGGAGRRLLIACFAGHAIFSLFRAVDALVNDPGPSFIEGSVSSVVAGLELITVIVLVNISVLAMLTERLIGSLERMASTDSLTETLTRRAFHTRAQRALDRSVRDHRPAAPLLFDLDHFKAINDKLGHAGGDAVLRAVAAQAHRVLRPTDLVGRLGGEEFGVFLPGADLVGGERAAERLRGAIRETPVPYQSRTITVTASFGVAAFPGVVPSIERLLAAADRALYAAKAAGRDCVRLVENPPESGPGTDEDAEDDAHDGTETPSQGPLSGPP